MKMILFLILLNGACLYGSSSVGSKSNIAQAQPQNISLLPLAPLRQVLPTQELHSLVLGYLDDWQEVNSIIIDASLPINPIHPIRLSFHDHYLMYGPVQGEIFAKYIIDHKPTKSILRIESEQSVAVFSGDGRYFARDVENDVIRIWEFKKGTYELLQDLGLTGNVRLRYITFSHEGKYVVIGYENSFSMHRIDIWRRNSLGKYECIEIKDEPEGLQFCYTENTMKSRSIDEILNMRQYKNLVAQTNSEEKIVFSANGLFMATSKREPLDEKPEMGSKTWKMVQKWKIWRSKDQKYELVQEDAIPDSCLADLKSNITISPNGEYIIFSSVYLDFLTIWQFRKNKYEKLPNIEVNGMVEHVIFSPNSLYFAYLLLIKGAAGMREIKIFGNQARGADMGIVDIPKATQSNCTIL
jgi:WD40 repeat protein